MSAQSPAKTKPLTNARIAKLSPRAGPYELPVESGLRVVIRPSGAKSFGLRYRFGGASRNLTLGPASIGVDGARKLTAKARLELMQGKDPAAEKREAKRQAKAEIAKQREAKRQAKTPQRETVAELVDGFLQRMSRKASPKTVDATGRLLRREVVAAWGARPIAEVSRADVRALLECVGERAPVMANRLLSTVRRLFAHAVDEELIARNPAAGIEPPHAETPRERVLDGRELASVWCAAERLDGEDGDFIRLLILTAARFSEVARLEWREVDLDNGVWTLPAARAKNRKAHVTPLSAPALRILQRLHAARVTDDGRVFRSSFSRIRDRIDAEIARFDGAPLAHWTPHDLRRTAATNLQSLGVAAHVVEKLLNHASGTFRGIVSIYQRHEYFAERRDALQALAAHIAALTGANIVPLSRWA
ncbi:site-specific integrase [Methylocystis sp. ATCC 49242]|uniref:tyrosine-type recombinase/integrase n=1 Tax=Methylocystis sp. ATCC 49242 TaxID=622637 RepID=UPI0001F879DF|nr:site-specific integrase [Methylocystis sp. ATCC 49242]